MICGVGVRRHDGGGLVGFDAGSNLSSIHRLSLANVCFT
ncbi:uncharacterized protein PgNI_09869 [Pyricularia grisea]|uniref:Uncharacterized protein n=1 Tax=Pyricularia grisea TaxID=148305 RepID=A0A6P8ATH0_PYRGI|nr:uncharacterized protein PgNI_09869 [Pyricularia grisea]TLD05429.1 hypothetical protein PgNI_09869 [Pyricularia grisea]